MNLMLLYVGINHENCRFHRISDMDNCLTKTKMTLQWSIGFFQDDSQGQMSWSQNGHISKNYLTQIRHTLYQGTTH